MSDLHPKRRCKCLSHDGDESWHGKHSGLDYHWCRCETCRAFGALRARQLYRNSMVYRENAKNRTRAKYIPKPKAPRKPTLVERRAAQWEAQNGLCALCGQPVALEKACLDHDHTCCATKAKQACGNCDRGVLHNACNSILGFANDDTALLLKAVDYLIGLEDAQAKPTWPEASSQTLAC